MREYIAKKLAIAVLVLIGVYTITFFLTFMLPGDPARVSLGQHGSEEAVELIRAQWGLDEPRYVQYINYLKGFIRGDMGVSFRYYPREVIYLIRYRLPVTAYYGLWSIIFAVAISVPLGVLAAYKQNTVIDNIAVLISQIGVSLPNFWLGMMLIAIISVKLGWINPVPDVPSGYIWSPVGFFASLKDYALPIITVGTGMMASNTRLTRSSMLEVVREDYITLARSKGLSERVVILKHALRNALIPVVTNVGLQFLLLVGGAVLTETVFGINGIGKLYIDAINYRDYPVVIALTLIYTGGVVIINLFVDILYSKIDPRVSLR
ncbi:MAG TPA: ABC transporter permease [Candidatus Methanofastidiosa archaeon]|nr:ABC transporter permease [Candidatus Methanofastidiosa archaeon]